MGQILRYDGDLSAEDRRRLAGLVAAEFRTPAAEAEEIVAQAVFLLGQKTDAGNSLAKLLTPIRAACSDSEQQDLLRMMLDVAGWHGAVRESQTDLIERTRHHLTT